MSKALLVVGPPDSAWAKALGPALHSFGMLDHSTAAEALIRIRSRRYDLLIVDAEEVHGFGPFVELIHRAAPDLPIVVVSVSPTWQHAREAFLAGATDYIRKSLAQEPLVNTVRDLLRQSPGVKSA